MTWTFAFGRVYRPTYYIDENGNCQIVTGSRPWRNNNPGNLEYKDFAKSHGAIGDDGRFAIFPDYETGRDALKKLFFGDDDQGHYDDGIDRKYFNKTIEEAIEQFAPRNENDTDTIILRVCDWSGIEWEFGDGSLIVKLF
jgi:hypothetical protein